MDKRIAALIALLTLLINLVRALPKVETTPTPPLSTTDATIEATSTLILDTPQPPAPDESVPTAEPPTQEAVAIDDGLRCTILDSNGTLHHVPVPPGINYPCDLTGQVTPVMQPTPEP